ncbi:MAG: arginine--tRNA ligase [Candidatus Pacebacteria bacterium]|nr:arginine--tRNA ligase [Candidatus Paceibacterota bacterium]
MLIRNEVQKIAKISLKKEGFEGFDFQVLKSKEKAHGDYSLSVALEIGKKEKVNPMEVAEKIKQRLEKEGKKFFEKVEVLPPGFINIFLNHKSLEKLVDEVLRKRESFGNLELGKGKKIQVEFVSANPTGPLTVGNARGGPFGDTLANVFIKAGFTTEKAYYINDYGNQIKTLGHSVLKDDEAKYQGEYIDFLHNRLDKETDPYKIGKWASYIILKEVIKATVEKMNIFYDEWFSESWLYENKRVDKVLEFLKKNNLTYESEGAIFFKAKEFGDNRDRVLVKTDGKATYLAGDIAYHEYKFKDKKFNKVINVWGADHAGDVKGLEAGIEALGYKDKLDTILLQFVTIEQNGEQVKMSKRLGTYITMDDLLNDVPVDVVRFFFLQKSANTHLHFNLELALEESDKNPVYYVKYAHARICSVLLNSNVNITKIKKARYAHLLKEEAELNLIKEILRFEEIIEDTAKDYGVHRLPQYALELAAAFHKFYNDCKIITEDKKISQARIELTLASKFALNNILFIMGISSPEKM